LATERRVGEVTVYFSGCRDVRQSECRLTVAPAVVANRKESVVFENWTSKRCAKLVLTKRHRLVGNTLSGFAPRGGANIEWIARVESVVAHVLKRGTVKLTA